MSEIRSYNPENSPLYWAALGLMGLRGVNDIYQDVQKSREGDFLGKSLLAGRPVTSEPGGPFRRLLSKTGLVSPDVTASGDTIMKELLALKQQDKTDAETTASWARTRGTLGTPAAGSPLARKEAKYGVDVPETTGEKRQRQSLGISQQRLKVEQQRVDQNTPEAAAVRELAKKRVDLSPAVTSGEVALAGAKGAASAGAGTRARLGVEAGPLGARAAYNVGLARAIGTGKGKNIALEQTPLKDIKDKDYYDPNTWLNLSQNKPNALYGEISDKPLLEVKKGSKDEIAIKDGTTLLSDLKELRKLVPSIFPVAGSPEALKLRGISNYRRSVSDANLNRIYSIITPDIIRLTYALQKRFPSQIEMNMSTNWWPDPGTPKGHLGIATSSDTQANVYAKIDRITNMVKKGVTSGILQGVPEEDSSKIEDLVHGAAGE